MLYSLYSQHTRIPTKTVVNKVLEGDELNNKSNRYSKVIYPQRP